MSHELLDALIHASDMLVCYQVIGAGKYPLGYVVIGNMGVLLLAEKVRISATLPGNHQVKTVTVSKWLKIPLMVRD